MNPIAKSIRDEIMERLPVKSREGFASSFDAVCEKASDVASTISARASSIKDKGYDTAFRFKNGFLPVEVWNFGDCIPGRLADICGYLYDAEYAECPDYLEDCLEAENVFRAIDKLDDTMMDVGHSDILGYKDVFEFEEKARDEVFMPRWMWFFDVLMNPDAYIAPLRPDGEGIANIGRVLTGEVTYEDVKSLPVSEARRVSKIMKTFADKCWGSSEGYAEGDTAFMTVEERGGDQWKKGQSLAIGFLTHTDKNWREHIWNRSNGYMSQKPREEIGIDWVAWVEDVLHAGDVMEVYADWFDDAPQKTDEGKKISKHAHTMSLRDSMRLLDKEESDKIESEVVAEARKVWEWIGKIGRGFWD